LAGFLITWCRLGADFYEKPLKVRVAYERYTAVNPHYANDYASLQKLTKAKSAFSNPVTQSSAYPCGLALQANPQLLFLLRNVVLLFVCWKHRCFYQHSATSANSLYH
jgi:hypothetical protein